MNLARWVYVGFLSHQTERFEEINLELCVFGEVSAKHNFKNLDGAVSYVGTQMSLFRNENLGKLHLIIF